MALILPVNNHIPKFGNDCFIAENATITGDVELGDSCSVWFNTVIRGDVHYIRIGHRVNIQDGAILHCTYQKAPLNIADDVSIGHAAIVHGCTIEKNVLIGMRALVMDHCVIGKNSIIAAGAVVTERTIVKPGSIYAGVPAKKVKSVEPKQLEELNRRIAENYIMYSSWYKS